MKVQEIEAKSLSSKEMEQVYNPVPNQAIDTDSSSQIKINRKTSKFSQTPEKTSKSNEANQDIEAISQDLSHFLNKNISDLEELEAEEISNEHLEILTEAFIHIFSPENLDKSSLTQKEDLLKWLLKLGGEDYMIEKLREDIMNIEEEDCIQRQVSKSARIQEEDNLSDRIIQELEEEERECTVEG